MPNQNPAASRPCPGPQTSWGRSRLLWIVPKIADPPSRLAVKAGNHRTKKEAVTAALHEYVNARRRREIFDWVGKVDYYDDYDPKQLRDRKAQ